MADVIEINLGVDIDKLLINNTLRYSVNDTKYTVVILNDDEINIVKTLSNIVVEDANITINAGLLRFSGTHVVNNKECSYSIMYKDGVPINTSFYMEGEEVTVNNSIILCNSIDVSNNSDYVRAYTFIVQYERRRLLAISEILGRMYLDIK